MALELFPGSGRFAAAWRRGLRRENIPIFEIDFKHGSQYDLCSPSLQRFIRGLIRSRIVCAVWLGTPCNSFSRARDIPGTGPGPLRSDSHIYGLPHLTGKDLLKVRIGNRMARFSIGILQLCDSMHVPAAMENPHTSRLWLLPGVQQLSVRKSFETSVVDYCSFGMDWRKRTRLLSCHVSFRMCFVPCTGRKTCSFSGRPHVQLRGTTKGVFKTLIAEPYPRGMCKLLVQRFRAVILAKLGRKIQVA